jgi:hypothetical protein
MASEVDLPPPGHYKSVPRACLASSRPAVFPKMRDLLDAAHIAALRDAAHARGSYTWKSSHSAALLQEIENLAGRRLPRPEYAQESEPSQFTDRDDEDDAETFFAAHEGIAVYRHHRVRERSARLVREKKAYVLENTGRLACEVCGFDFQDVYGELGKDFAECHHAVPLSECSDDGRNTTIADLAIVCANCHRMLHLRRPWLVLGELSKVLRIPASDKAPSP